MMPSLNDIELFVEVARSQSFTHAGEVLDMPASTLSRRLTQLEKSIGVRLLNRTTRKVSLTEAGANYYQRCQHIVEEARVAHEMLIDGVSQPRGRLRVSLPTSLALAFLQEALFEFSQRYPDIECEYDLSIRKINLQTDPYDLVIRVVRPESSGAVSRRLGVLNLGLYAAESYLQAQGVPQTPDELSAHQCLRASTERGDSTWQLYAEDGRQQQVRVSGRMALNQVMLLRRMAEMGAGIVPMSIGDVGGSGLVRVLPDWTFEPVPLVAFYASRMMPARARVFLDFLIEQLSGVKILMARNPLLP